MRTVTPNDPHDIDEFALLLTGVRRWEEETNAIRLFQFEWRGDELRRSRRSYPQTGRVYDDDANDVASDDCAIDDSAFDDSAFDDNAFDDNAFDDNAQERNHNSPSVRARRRPVEILRIEQP